MSYNRYLSVVTSKEFFVVWAMLAVLAYLFVDKNLALFFYTHHAPIWQHVAYDFTDFGYSQIYLIAFPLLLLLALILKKRRLAMAACLLLLVVIVPGVVCDILKPLFGRARPDMLFHHGLYGFYFLQKHAHMWSFPSGHTTTIIGVSMALAFLLPRWWLVFLGFGVVVSLSRVVVTAHYLSDVMAGWYLATMVATSVYMRLMPRIELILKNRFSFQ